MININQVSDLNLKFYCFIVCILIGFTSIAQEPAQGIFPLKDGQIYYEKVVQLDSISKDQIYRAAKTWGVNAFKSQKDVIQADDRELGLIAYKAFFTVHFSAPKIMGAGPEVECQYWFTMKIFMKDNKVKITIESIYLNTGPVIKGVPETPSILSFKEDTEEYLQKGMLGKGYREKYYSAAKENFSKANISFTQLISNLQNSLKSGKEEFDF